ncbi:MAG: class I SAM-dependent methyltransferase [Pseudomonadales bacterium]
MQLLIDELGLVKPGYRILHIAPERGIFDRIHEVPEIEYHSFDLQPEQYEYAGASAMDLATDAEHLPSNFYDLIIHSHVMEHVPCNITAVLFHLHRSLSQRGTHLFCVPILSGASDEFLGEMEDAERIARFGQIDHVRRFGTQDIQKTIGMVFEIPLHYELESVVPAQTLENYNIPAHARSGFTSSTVFVVAKSQLKLVS